MAEALYRKYRPQIFEDVVGQDHIERTIKNAIENDKVSHAYLFTGPRGTGKTTTARLLAKALLCEKGPTSEPDGTCENCNAVANGTHPDVYELDAASRTGVENVREEIIGRVQFAPTRGRYKVYIIDEVHMLSTAAFNALLKTLEEPPSHVVFILCTTDPQKVPETIHSRCQRFDFHRISVEAMVSRLGAICTEEDVEFEGDALELIAHRAEGGMRNALTSLEQAIAFGEGKVTLETAESLLGSLDSNDLAEIVDAIGRRDIAKCFEWTSEYVETGADLAQFVRDLAEHIRNMYILSLANSDTVLEVDEVVRRELAQELQYFGPDRLSRMLGVLGDLISELKTSTNPRLSFEIALTRMVRPDSDVTLESLAERVEALESGYSAVAHVPAGMTSAPSVAPAAESSLFTSPPAPQPNATQIPVATSTSASNSAPVSVSAVSTVAPVGPAPVSEEINDQILNEQGDASAQASATQTQSSSSSDFPCQTGNAVNLENPAALQRIWQAALQVIKKEKAAYSVLLLNTKVNFEKQSGSLLIEFPPENVFAYSAVQKPEAMSVITAAIKQAAGDSIPFRIVQGSGEAKPITPKPITSPTPVPDATSAPMSAPSVASRATPASQPAPTSTAPPVSAPDLDEPPVDIYDTYANSFGEDESSYTAPFSNSAVPMQPVGHQPTQPAVQPPNPDSLPADEPQATPLNNSTDSSGQDALQAMLAQEYGDGIKIDIIEE